PHIQSYRRAPREACRRAFAALPGPIVDLLGGEDPRPDLEGVDVERAGGPEAAAGLADLGAAELEIDGRPIAERADEVERAEAVGLDEIVVVQDLARDDL